MKNIVGIAALFILIFILTSGAAHAATVSYAKIYVENSDDDNQWVKLYIDGVYMRGVMVSRNTSKYIEFYQFIEGPHELKVEWKDQDTCEWQENTKTVDITKDVKTVTIGVVPNSESTCKKAETAKEATIYGGLDVYVLNKDDDTLFVTLYINQQKKGGRTIASNDTVRVRRFYSMTPGTYDIKIRWREPDKNEWHEKTQEITVGEGENEVTLETDEIIYKHVFTKPNSAIDIYVENVDDDDLWVSVYVDTGFAIKYIKSGTYRHIKNFDKLHQGGHRVKMKWMDPDVMGWQEREFVIYLGKGEEASRTFQIVKRTR